MKKIIALCLVVLLIAFCAVACTGGNDNGNNGDNVNSGNNSGNNGGGVNPGNGNAPIDLPIIDLPDGN